MNYFMMYTKHNNNGIFTGANRRYMELVNSLARGDNKITMLAEQWKEFSQNPHIDIIGEGAKRSFVRKSRYWKETWAVENDEEAVKFIVEQFGNESLRPVVIPCSDGAVAEIDRNLDELSKKFLVPSLNGRQGKIVELMNKKNQVAFAKKFDLPVAQSWIVELNPVQVPVDIVYPCIVKPVLSFEGKKTDIKKCCCEEELTEYLAKLKKCNYSHVLVQEYLDFDFEMVLCGCCMPEPAWFILRKVRRWPAVGGSGSFFRILCEPSILDKVKQVINALREENYIGLYDIEFFCVNGQIYLNEFNWRNSGNSFMCMGTKVYYPVIWYMSLIGQDTSRIKHIVSDSSFFAMDEKIDLRQVLFNHLPFKKWLKDLRKTSSFAIWNKRDIVPVIYEYSHLMIKMFFGKTKKKG